MPEQQTCVSIGLFGDFSYELRDEETGSFYIQPLGDLARHKGQWIERTLGRLSQIVRQLVEVGCWTCHWSGLDFYLKCPRPRSEAIQEFSHSAETAAEWFHIDGEGSKTGLCPRPYAWGSQSAFYSDEPSAQPRYQLRSIVQIDVLSEFEMEMELSGVAQCGCPYSGSRPPRIQWPSNGLSIGAEIRDLGQAVHERLDHFAHLFDIVSREPEPWLWGPNEQCLLYGAPLPPQDARYRLEQWEVPMDRVRIETPDDYCERQTQQTERAKDGIRNLREHDRP